MNMTTKNFLKRYDEFMKTEDKKDNLNKFNKSILNIAKAVKKPSFSSVDEKEFINYVKKSKYVGFNFVKIKNEICSIEKAVKCNSLWNKAECNGFIISHSNKFDSVDMSVIISTIQKYFDNFQIATFEDDRLNEKIGIGFYMVY